MRVLYDGYWWPRGPLAARQVMLNLLTTWRDLFPGDEIGITVPAHAAPDLKRMNTGVEFIPVHLRPHGISVLVEYGRIARRWGADVVLTQNFTARHAASFTFVHDLIFEDHPDWFTFPERTYFSLMTRSARRARVVFASTEVEATRMRRVLGRRTSVRAVGLGVDPTLLSAVPRRPEVVDVEGFALTVGRLNVRKNLDVLCRAAATSDSITREHPLLVVGERDGRDRGFSAEASEAIRARRIRLIGAVSVCELAWLYSNCSIFAYMSLDEGFGFPPVEAAWFGAPVLTSNLPVFRENLGSVATFVDPSSVSAISGEISRMITQSALRSQARSPAPSELQRFSWSATARRIRQEVEEALVQDGRRGG